MESFEQPSSDIFNQIFSPLYFRMLDDLVDTLNKMNSLDLTAPISETTDNLSAIVSSMSTLSKQASQIPDVYIQLSQDLMDDLDRVYAQSRELGIPDWQDEHEQPLSPVPTEKGAPLITIDRAITLLSLLCAILSIVIALLPNAQLDELIQQNERLIDVQEEQLTLERQRTE